MGLMGWFGKGSRQRLSSGSRRKHQWHPLAVNRLEAREVPSATARPTVIFKELLPAGSPPAAPFIYYFPDQIRTAYGINSIAFSNGTITGDGSGQTIAIVDAYNDPNIVNDLDVFDNNVYLSGSDQTNGLTLYNRYGAAASFFSVFDQNGNVIDPSTETTVPDSGSSGWSLEESLDVEWAHSIAPGAKIDLIEANSNDNDLYTAEVTAGGLAGVSAVSNSWGAGEGFGENSLDSDFVHTGVTFLASTGDSGTPGGYPAYSPNVVAVGGTSLYLNSDNTYQSESGWSGSGGGVSITESEPVYQEAVQTTGQRTTPDVALPADPNTGAVVYDSYDYDPHYFVVVGGTSWSSPSWAGLIAIANQGRLADGGTLLNCTDPTQTLSLLYGLSSSDWHNNLGINNGSTITGLTNPATYDENTGLGSPLANVLVPDLASAGLALSAPTVTSVNPSAGPLTGNTSVTITGTGFSSVTEVDFGTNPATSFVINSDTQITAISPQGAAGTVDITVVNPGGTSSTSSADQFTYTANLVISPSSLSPATANQSYSVTFLASNGSGSYTFTVSAGSLPPSLSLSTAGVLSGIPTTASSYTFTIQATDNNDTTLTGTQQYTLTVNPASSLTLSPQTLPVATVKNKFGPVTLTATGGYGSYTFALASGSKLPTGLTLTKSGVLSGTPTLAGTYTFTIIATDSHQNTLTGSQQYTLTVNKAITVTPSTLPVATVGDPFSKQLAATGGSGTGYTFALAAGSSLPQGFSLSSAGLLTGNPVASGTFSFTIIATDSNGATGSRTYTLTIDPALIISPSPSLLPPATKGQAYSQQFTASGGSGSGYLWKAKGLPTWLKMSSTGLLSGTPPSTARASITFTITVTDSKHGTLSVQYTLTIN